MLKSSGGTNKTGEMQENIFLTREQRFGGVSDPAMRIFLCGLLKEAQRLATRRGLTVEGFYTTQIFSEGYSLVGREEIAVDA